MRDCFMEAIGVVWMCGNSMTTKPELQLEEENQINAETHDIHRDSAYFGASSQPSDLRNLSASSTVCV